MAQRMQVPPLFFSTELIFGGKTATCAGSRPTLRSRSALVRVIFGKPGCLQRMVVREWCGRNHGVNSTDGSWPGCARFVSRFRKHPRGIGKGRLLTLQRR
jgi:hypothetical protein